MLRSIKEATLESIREAHINHEFRTLGHQSLCLEHLLSYRHGLLLNEKEVFQSIHEVMALFQLMVQSLKDEITHKQTDQGQPKKDWDKPRQRRIVELTKQVDKTIQLFMYITEEGKISSDLGKLANILGSQEKISAGNLSDLDIQL